MNEEIRKKFFSLNESRIFPAFGKQVKIKTEADRTAIRPEVRILLSVLKKGTARKRNMRASRKIICS